ncbi:hypothetical protein [Mucilaginibacter myungsuensis]|uniref:Peptidase M23-like protein n=1 Tax=Mucilaginibacter myungsuensis TaxID=649104 RepID=A0A929KXA7_9SPHI|nr:hypothetical protein [Mucilaginibacter myungsuensis]MBE9662185.1 hypothetical protein [Mucilaginibacter myungsuensis]MDN3599381.1 hypothetical protein [Mucilaginibacter myungsuensis]
MKKVVYALVCSLVVLSGLVFADHETKKETPKKPATVVDQKAAAEARKKWENSPDGVRFKKWKDSPEGMRILASGAKVRGDIKAFTGMEATITALAVSPPARVPGFLVTIGDETYILDLHSYKERQNVKDLKVNDKVTIKSHGGAYSPKHPHYIISAERIEQNGKLIFKRVLPKGGC